MRMIGQALLFVSIAANAACQSGADTGASVKSTEASAVAMPADLVGIYCGETVEKSVAAFAASTPAGFDRILSASVVSDDGKLQQTIRVLTAGRAQTEAAYDLALTINVGDDACSVDMIKSSTAPSFAGLRDVFETPSNACKAKLSTALEQYVGATWDFDRVESFAVRAKSSELKRIEAVVLDLGHDEGTFNVYVSANCDLLGIEQTTAFTP